MAQKEMEFYDKRITLIRTNNTSRIMVLCRIYVLLRDSKENNWRVTKLEAENLEDLYVQVQGLALGAGDEGITSLPEALATLKVCKKYLTLVHGNTQCPWSALSNALARKGVRDALKYMASEGAKLEDS